MDVSAGLRRSLFQFEQNAEAFLKDARVRTRFESTLQKTVPGLGVRVRFDCTLKYVPARPAAGAVRCVPLHHRGPLHSLSEILHALPAKHRKRVAASGGDALAAARGGERRGVADASADQQGPEEGAVGPGRGGKCDKAAPEQGRRIDSSVAQGAVNWGGPWTVAERDCRKVPILMLEAESVVAVSSQVTNELLQIGKIIN